MKKYLILVLSAALLLAFFGCGSPKEGPEDTSSRPSGFDPENYDDEELVLPAKSKAPSETGEIDSELYIFSAEVSAKIKAAEEEGVLRITYSASKDYAVGEIGWIDIENAGPVIIGNGSNKKQDAYYDIRDFTEVFGADGTLTIHIFNGAKLNGVTLYTPKEGYEPNLNNPKATAGSQKIIIPIGHPLNGNGDLSKADFKKITTGTYSKLVFYFAIKEGEEEAAKDRGILKFGPKCGSPYTHYGISKSGDIIDGDEGWRAIGEEIAKQTITYDVSVIKAGVTKAGKGFNKLEINMGKVADKKADLVYIELQK